jgi:hypothetical protein
MSSPVPTLLTVKQFSEKHPAFSEGAIRWMIFKAGSSSTIQIDDHDKAFKNVVVRVGRRVYIDEAKFFQWTEG